MMKAMIDMINEKNNTTPSFHPVVGFFFCSPPPVKKMQCREIRCTACTAKHTVSSQDKKKRSFQKTTIYRRKKTNVFLCFHTIA